jgi:hypothetical protein
MSLAFSRTTRALQADNFYISFSGLAIGLGLTAAWAAWFFFYDVPQLATSQMAHVMGPHTMAGHVEMAGMMSTEEMDDMAGMAGMPDMSWLEGLSGMEGAVLPLKEKIVAYFPAPIALGQIQPGQRARVIVDGFPALVYGDVPGVVVRVGTEVIDQQVQVDLELEVPPAAIPLRHGMTARVQVEVNRASPAGLMLRSLSALLAGPQATASPASP